MKNSKALKLINKNQYTCVMNNTKWKKLIKALSENNFYEPEIKLKYIGDIHPEEGFSLVWCVRDQVKLYHQMSSSLYHQKSDQFKVSFFANFYHPKVYFVEVSRKRNKTLVH